MLSNRWIKTGLFLFLASSLIGVAGVGGSFYQFSQIAENVESTGLGAGYEVFQRMILIVVITALGWIIGFACFAFGLMQRRKGVYK